MTFGKCSPGYTRLEVQKLYRNRTVLRLHIRSMIKTDGNRFFLSSEEFLKSLENMFINNWTNLYGNVCLKSHEPCLSITVNNLKDIPLKVVYDIKYGIKCHYWPAVAFE